MIYCAFLALIFLKKRLYIHHWTSICTVVAGVCLVGYSYLTTSDEPSTNLWAGLIVLQIAQLFGAVAYIAEEKFLGDFDSLDPLILVVGEGVAGCLIFLVVLPIAQFIPCSNEQLCTNGKVADTMQAFRDFGANPILILYAAGMFFFCTLLVCNQMWVVKFGSAAQKTSADILRPMFIWLFFMTVPVYNFKTDAYEYEEEFSWLQLGGYIIIIIGVFVYNEILVVPFWGFNRNTKIAIQERADRI